jgi:hypothetical protein
VEKKRKGWGDGSSLLDRCSITWATPSALVPFVLPFATKKWKPNPWPPLTYDAELSSCFPVCSLPLSWYLDLWYSYTL